MKLKFRADPKDWMIFGFFAVFVLYFSAVLVLNLSSFATTGNFHGFNPFPAFSSEYFAPTMVVFIGILIALITSVSSHFFEREKGFGFSSDSKKEKGYARWATDKEMKKELTKIDPLSEQNDAGGIPIIMNKKGIWVDNGGYHNLIIGSTGAGKTQTTVFPMVKNLSKHDESMIITDPKGEIYEETAEMLKERGYNIVLLNFRDPQQGNSWNPLSLPYRLYQEKNFDKAIEILDDLALNILYDESSKNQDPFWEKTSADYFAGLSQALFEDATEDQINLNSINLMTTVGEDKFMGTTYMKEYFSYKDPSSAAYINVSSTLNAPNETKGSILSVFRQKIKLFATRDNLSEMLSHSDFDMKDIGRKKTAVFIVIQDEKKTYHSLVTIFLKQCYETLISVAQESGGKLPHRTNFILDEFANMPPLKDVTTMVTAARSRNIRFNFIIQNFSQLYDVYGKENGETIKGNCGNIVYLISSELSALEEISKMCGEVKSGEKDKTASTPLVTVSDLQRLKMWDIIVLRSRMMPFKTTLTPNFEMDWGKQYPKSTYPKREKSPVQIFDLKKFVEAKKEAKMRELLGSSAPPMGGMSGMPGMGSMNPFGKGMPGMPNMSGMGMPSSPMGTGFGMPGMEMSSMQSPPSTPPPKPNGEALSSAVPNTIMPSASGGGFDVDDLIKRIDAKIAELEEEEKQEKLKQEAHSSAPVHPTVTSVESPNQAPSQPVMQPTQNQLPKAPIQNIAPPLPKKTPKVEVPLTSPSKKEKPIPLQSPVTEARKVVSQPSFPQVSIQEPTKTEFKKEVPVIDSSVLIPKVNAPKPEPTTETRKAVPSTSNKVEAIDDYITDDQFFDDFFNEE